MKNYATFVLEKNSMKVYRGIGPNINATYGGVSDAGMGVFWTDNLTIAKWFGGMIEFNPETGKYDEIKNSTGKVIQKSLNLKNPYIYDIDHKDYDVDNGWDSFQIYMEDIKTAGGVQNYKQNLINKGYDGIYLIGNNTNYYVDNGTYNVYIEF